MREPDVPGLKASAVILGAGVSGLSAALNLLQRGYGVTLLERGAVGGEIVAGGGRDSLAVAAVGLRGGGFGAGLAVDGGLCGLGGGNRGDIGAGCGMNFNSGLAQP